DADFYIRTCDGNQFKIFKTMLRLASPVFNDMFLVGDEQTSSTTLSESENVTNVTEPAKTIDALLRYIYPVRKPDITSLPDLLSLLEASIKYDVLSTPHMIVETICSPEILNQDPFLCYVVGCQ
ncbi:hypothetical protein SISNIDRAFT_389376, partial [Sistotremastrum niveocremeum HHB9708]